VSRVIGRSSISPSKRVLLMIDQDEHLDWLSQNSEKGACKYSLVSVYGWVSVYNWLYNTILLSKKIFLQDHAI